MLRRRKRRPQAQVTQVADAYRGLRSMALDAVAQAGLTPTAEHPDVCGVVVDIPSEGGFATIVALADDTTSMYTSTGGGTIGAGAHPAVAAATHRLLAVVQAHLWAFAERDDQALQAPERVRLHVLAADVGRCADVPLGAFWGRERHELTPVIASVQDVVSAIRTASPT